MSKGIKFTPYVSLSFLPKRSRSHGITRRIVFIQATKEEERQPLLDMLDHLTRTEVIALLTYSEDVAGGPVAAGQPSCCSSAPCGACHPVTCALSAGRRAGLA